MKFWNTIKCRLAGALCWMLRLIHAGGTFLCSGTTFVAKAAAALLLIALGAQGAVLAPQTLFPSSAAALSYSNTVMADNPVAYWRLNETSGSTATDVRGTNNATWVGTPTFSQGGAVAGDNSTLNRTNSSYAFVNDSAPLSITGPLTLEAWIYRTNNNTANYGVLAKYLGTPNQRSYSLIVLTASTAPAFQVGTGTSAITVTAAGGSPSNGWMHVVGVYTPSTSIIIYTNGVPSATNVTSVPASIFDGTNRVSIGSYAADASTDVRFPGRLDELAIYNTALSAERVQAHYDARNNP